MVPPEELEKTQPATLPADFSEWDSGDAAAAQPASFKGFEAVPKPSAKLATERQVAVLPVADRPLNGASRASAAAYTEARQVFQPPQPQELRREEKNWQDKIESKGKHQGMVLYAALGSAAFLLIAGALGYFELRPRPVTPKQVVAPQVVATPETQEKPLAATAATTTTKAQSIAPADAQPNNALNAQSAIMSKQLAAPSRIPNDIRVLAGQEPPPSAGFAAPGGEGLGAGNSVFSGQTGPKVKIEAPGRLNISEGIAGGMLIHRSAPVYPQIAKEARISGTVVIHATISKTGTIINPRVLSGPTGLRQSALEALRTWRYRPYQLNGEPVEVETTVSVVFSLGQ